LKSFRALHDREADVVTYLLAVLFVLLAVAAWLLFGAVRRARFARRVERARREYFDRQQECQVMFLQAAAATGKPRGLTWNQCELGPELILARDRANGELVGLAPATINFEAIAGGGMEEVEAVGNLRAATAVFTYNGSSWTTQGRVVFNLEPREVLDRYRENLDPV
jgi:hypothetical protein